MAITPVINKDYMPSGNKGQSRSIEKTGKQTNNNKKAKFPLKRSLHKGKIEKNPVVEKLRTITRSQLSCTGKIENCIGRNLEDD